MKAIFERIEDYEHIIWDWNGTLLDDVETCLTVLQQTLTAHGITPPNLEDYRAQFHFPVKSYYESLGIDFSDLDFEKMSDEFVAHHLKNTLENGKLFDGTIEILEHIAQNHAEQSVLSAAHQKYLEHFLKHFEIHHLFDRIFGLSDNMATCKKERGLALISESKIEREQTILIGDTDHDLEVAKNLGIDALIIADGHQCFQRLSKLHHNVIESRFEILK